MRKMVLHPGLLKLVVWRTKLLLQVHAPNQASHNCSLVQVTIRHLLMRPQAPQLWIWPSLLIVLSDLIQSNLDGTTVLIQTTGTTRWSNSVTLTCSQVVCLPQQLLLSTSKVSALLPTFSIKLWTWSWEQVLTTTTSLALRKTAQSWAPALTSPASRT